ncbi:MAG TPA: ATP-dependent DNA ligase [Mycobacteriales bacterium]|nr:ATP-dependent DNA ligase [Mycobacteriales bacterium]
MLLADVVAASRDVAATSSRSAKVARLADLLRAGGAEHAPVLVPWLAGELRQRRTGIGWAALRDAPPPAAEPTLRVVEVDDALETAADLAGPGSTTARRELVHSLFGRATLEEQQFLRGLVSGELRQGALEGVMLDAVAKAADVPLPAVRRAAMLCGAAAPVAVAAMTFGAAGLAGFGLEVGRPLQPMLASTAGSVEEALGKLGRAAVEWKLDGIRVQVHRSGSDVGVFTRSLDDITGRVPEIVAAAQALPITSFVLDGEAIALRADGRPRPFQETGSRAATQTAGAPVGLSWFVFDALHIGGADLLDLAFAERHHALAEALPESLRVPRIVTDALDEAESFFRSTVAQGHEGVVVKSLEAPYDAGRRGASWLKVKPVHTLDLVVLAAEWGHGRRRGWLSNLHLGARDPSTGTFVMLGKTFKGLTDELLRWQTSRFLELETSRNEWQVFVRPELVVEIAFDGVQTSPRYPGGVALRFARVLRYRDDKRPDEADTVDTVRAFLP